MSSGHFSIGCFLSDIRLDDLLVYFVDNPLSIASFTIIFSYCEGCLFNLFMNAFAVQKCLSLIRSHLFIFVFIVHYSRRWVIKDFAAIYVRVFYLWRRQWHPTPVLLPGKSHGRRSLVGCPLWGRTESDTTEVT